MTTQYDLEMQKLYKEFIEKGSKEDGAPKLPIVCPTNYGKPCRLCDLSKTILFKKDNDGTPLRAKASELNRKQAYYSNVVFPTNPSDLIIFQYGYSIWKEMMLFQMGPGSEVTDWLDPKLGRNVVITKTSAGGNKRRTTYSTKTKINASPLLDMSVLRKLSQPEYQLDKIVDLILSGQAKPMYQSALQEGPNELRFLPSWIGPGISKFFQLVLYHYGVTPEEFDMIQKGEYNPFAGIDVEEMVAGAESIPLPSPKPKPIEVEVKKDAAKSLWDEYIKPKVDAPVGRPSETPTASQAYPPCYGKMYDPDDTECTKDCAEDGWADTCKSLLEEKSKVEKRKTAKRLVQ